MGQTGTCLLIKVTPLLPGHLQQTLNIVILSGVIFTDGQTYLILTKSRRTSGS